MRVQGMVLAALLAILIGSCAPAPAVPTSGDANPVRGGTVVIAIWQEPTTLLSQYSGMTTTFLISNLISEGLTQTGPDGSYQPVLAQRVPTIANGGVKLSADGKRMDVTYELVSGVKWSDGSPLTSADVKFTWENYLRDPKVSTKDGYDQIESVETPTPTTAILHYKSLYGPYLTRFNGLLPASLAKETDLSRSEYSRKPIGTGPFVITEFVSGDHITAERNPLYRVKDRPYVDRIIFQSVPSQVAAAARLKAGQVDGMWNLSTAQLPDLESDPGINVLATPGPSVERIELNHAKPGDPADPAVPHPVLGDQAMRRALNLATPKQQIVDKLLLGRARIGTSPVSQGWASPRGLSQEAYDPARARQVLDAAGWVAGADGIRTKAGTRAAISITTTTDDRTREQIEAVLIDEWKRIGVELSVRNLPATVLLSGSWTGGDPRKRGNFDAVLYASSPGIDPHQTMLRYTSSAIPTAANSGAGLNFTRFRNAEADAAVREAGSIVDLTRRAELYAKTLKLLNDDVAIIWLFDRQNLDAFRRTVRGTKGSTWTEMTWNAQEWWIQK